LGFSEPRGHVQPTWVFNASPTARRAQPRLTWIHAPNGQDYLIAEVSLPKMLHGSNVVMLHSDNEISESLTLMSDLVSNVARVNYEATTAKVSAVHFCYNFQMTPRNVSEYIKALSNTTVARTERTVYQNQTVYFSNDTRTLIAYDKLCKTLASLPYDEATNEDVELAKGVLRVESRFKTRQACERLARSMLGFDNRRAETLLTVEIAERMINQSIRIMGLDMPIENGDARIGCVFDMFTPKYAAVLAGFITVCGRVGPENVVRHGFYTRTTFYRHRKELVKAGLWLKTEGKHKLPALRIVSVNEHRRGAQASFR
jgi:hypothetical protein